MADCVFRLLCWEDDELPPPHLTARGGLGCNNPVKFRDKLRMQTHDSNQHTGTTHTLVNEEHLPRSSLYARHIAVASTFRTSQEHLHLALVSSCLNASAPSSLYLSCLLFAPSCVVGIRRQPRSTVVVKGLAMSSSCRHNCSLPRNSGVFALNDRPVYSFILFIPNYCSFRSRRTVWHRSIMSSILWSARRKKSFVGLNEHHRIKFGCVCLGRAMAGISERTSRLMHVLDMHPPNPNNMFVLLLHLLIYAYCEHSTTNYVCRFLLPVRNLTFRAKLHRLSNEETGA